MWIAIVGIACRFPGGVCDVDSFWRLVSDGVEAVGDVPRSRFDVDDIHDSTPGVAGKIHSRRGGFLDEIDRFDADFFNISPREAIEMDPEQRLLLEVAYEAFEDAGQTIARRASAVTGVFVGQSSEALHPGALEDEDLFAQVGRSRAAFAGRLSYALGLEGPSLVVNSDRSSSLVAVHLACQSLRAGECDLAVASGSSLILSPRMSVAFSRAGMLAPDGKGKFGDARADGFVRSEGVGVVVLKPMEKAIADDDPIYAVIRGSASNHGGGRAGDLLAPSLQAQIALLRSAYRNAAVAPGEVALVEAHGTGTPRGDEVELGALGAVLGEGRPVGQRCAIGSVKTNIGHTEAASGIAGLIKAALSLQHGEIPPSLHFETPNPRIPFHELPIFIPTERCAWPAGSARLAGVSSFGLFGTNAHVVLAAAPARGLERASGAAPASSHLFLLSARNRSALDGLARRYLRVLQDDRSTLADLAHSVAARRDHHDEARLAVVARSTAELTKHLTAFLGGEAGERPGTYPVVQASPVRAEALPPKVVFVCSGQGSHWVGMGQQLLREEPVFRAALERCDEAFQTRAGWSLLSELAAAHGRSRLSEQRIVQPALFSMSVALAALWQSFGVEPSAVVGTSVGEVAAAHIAGALSLEEAVHVICSRSELMQRLHGRGSMASLRLTIEEARAELASVEDRVFIAASNGPTSTVISGDSGAVQTIVARVEGRGVFARLLKVDMALHSPLVEPIAEELRVALAGLAPRAPQIPMVSTVTGEAVARQSLNAEYWVRNLREPILLTHAMQRLCGGGHDVFLELSPHPTLVEALLESVHAHGSDGIALASLRREEGERASLLSSAGALYVRGCPLHLSALSLEKGRAVRLPSYPWQGVRFPRPARASGEARAPARASDISVSEPLEEARSASRPAVLDDAPSNKQRAAVRDIVTREVRQILKLDAGALLGAVRPFRDFGLTSLMAVELRSRLGVALARALPATLLFDHPSIDALVRFLEGGAVATGGRPSTAPMGPRRRSNDDPIAIVGMGCRFPGGANGPDALWGLLRDGVDAISEVPRDRWDVDALYDPDPDAPGKMCTRFGGFVDGVDRFDPAFFGIVPREAKSLDPQQRLLLEVSWEALEHASVVPAGLSGSKTGVFIGIWSHDYARRANALAAIDAYVGTGNFGSVAAGRIAYTLGLEGPCLSVDTACSSSLVALHLACLSLRQGECELALAGGVNLVLSPEGTVYFSKLHALSPDGRCKAFDDGANGYVRSDGAGVVVLKRLSRAQADGDRILAIVRGTAINDDGRSNGLTAPSGTAQEAVVRSALDQAAVEPHEIAYVECHGTGTPLGDPIEVHALARVLGHGRGKDAPALLGSVKSNIGHTEAASGIAGLMKVVLSLQHEHIPKTLHCRTPNRHVPWSELPVAIATEGKDWKRSERRRIAGVSSFGISGANAHAILEEAPPRAAEVPAPEAAAHLLTLSARSPSALAEQVDRYARHLASHPDVSIADVCHTAARGRTHFEHRLAMHVVTREGALRDLEAAARGEAVPGCVRGLAGASRPKVAFLFPGQGSQYVGMGRDLFETQPVFRRALGRCAEALDPLLDRPLLETLYGGDADVARIDETQSAQAALFAIAVSLAELWRSWGITPDVVVGQSQGEIAAACVAGALSLEDAAKVVCRRGRLLSRVSGRGAMATVALSEAKAAKRIGPYGERLSIAVLTGPFTTVLSGEPEAMQDLLGTLEAEGVFCRRLKVDYASHSAQMDPLREDLRSALADIAPRIGSVPLFSTVLGERLQGKELGAEYWVDNLRRPARFAPAVSTLLAEGFLHFVELSPHPAFGTPMSSLLEASAEGICVGSLRRGENDVSAMLKSLGELHVRGARVDFGVACPGRATPLPTYPFARERHWLDEPVREPERATGLESPIEEHLYEVRWRAHPSRVTAAKTDGVWLVLGDAAGLGPALATSLEERGARVARVLAAHGGRKDLEERLAELRGDGPVRGVVHLQSLGGPANADLELDDLARASACGVESALELVQAVTANGAPPPALFFVTRGVHAVGHSPGPIAIAQAPLVGLARVVSLEHPGAWGGLVDLAPAPENGEAAALAGQLVDPEGEDDVAIRDNVRYVARLTRYRLPARQARFSCAGTWLVTGGLGALGLQVARWLIGRGVASLVLTGRQGIETPGAKEAAAALRAQGANVHVVAADASVERDVDAVLTMIRTELPPLRGIVHAAGVKTHTLLHDATAADLEATLAAKVRGAFLLHRGTRDLDLDAFVTFSSGVSVWGSAGQGAYAAANAFLDALVRERRRIGLAGLSVNWGAWSGGGMTSADEQRRLERQGLRAFSGSHGLRALESLLSAGATQVAVADFDWPRFRDIYEARRPSPLLREMEGAAAPAEIPTAHLEWVQRLLAAPGGTRAGLLAELVRGEVAATLGFERGDAIDPQRGFFSIGMDSVTAVDLRKRLDARLGIRMPATTVFNHPTVAKLTADLLVRLALEAPAPAARATTSIATSVEPIAIVGMGCRFPGGASDPAAFWSLLERAEDAVRPIPKSRWDVDRYYDADPEAMGKMYVREAALIEDWDRFDASFFGISPREAASMDPQQRLLLETTIEALEDAGLTPDALRTRRFGVFAGAAPSDYGLVSRGGDVSAVDAYEGTGNMLNMAAGRLSFVLGAQGPSLTVDTACSSSLVALHLACQSLRHGECEAAVACGVNVLVSPERSVTLSRLRALSPDGRCKTFSADADGYGRGEGCGVLVLKRLSDAEADGDRILAVVRGSAINHDGASSGLTVPNGQSQEATLRLALAAAAVAPEDVSYIEAHGTGTQMGDPIEIEALASVYCAGRSAETPLTVGTVKTNIGHLEAAAGIAGVIKVVLSLAHERVPAHLHCERKSPHTAWDTLPIVVPTEALAWPRGAKRRIAGVSSFGISGTNAHVVMEEGPSSGSAVVEGSSGATERPCHVLTLSARSAVALREQALRYAAHWSAFPELLVGEVCHTAAVGRSHFEHRLSLVGGTREGLIGDLTSFGGGESPRGARHGEAFGAPKVAFLFTGQGSQHVGMARELFETQPVFRRVMEECAGHLDAELPAPLLSVLYPAAGAPSRIDETCFTQAALFAVEYALSEVWRSWGVVPEAVIGHSVGELVAACVAGVFSVRDGLRLVAARGRLMGALPAGGTMVSVRGSEERVRALLSSLEASAEATPVSIAAVNGPEQVVVSGVEGEVRRVVALLEREGLETKRLAVSHAFHSSQMAPMVEAFRKVASTVTYRPSRIPLFGNVHGRESSAEVSGAAYWAEHVLCPVRFGAGMGALLETEMSAFVEIGPSPTLLTLAQGQAAASGRVWLASLRPGRGDWETMLGSLSELYVRGARVDWNGFDAPYPRRRRVVLPTYPFQRERYWIEPASDRRQRAGRRVEGARSHAFLGARLPLAGEAVVFESVLHTNDHRYLEEHRVFGKVVVVATAQLEMARAAAESVFGEGEYALEGVLVQQALVLPESGGQIVQVHVRTEGADVARFEIHSQEEGAENRPFTLHSSGRVRRVESLRAPQAVDLASLKERCPRATDPAAIYEAVEVSGGSHGPAFRVITELWRGEGEALARLHVPPGRGGGERFPFEPALLDAAVVTLVSAFMASEQAKVERLYIPFEIEEFRYQPPTGDVWAHVRLRDPSAPSGEILPGEIALYDGAGNGIGHFRGLRCKRVEAAALRSPEQDPLAQCLYHVDFRPAPRPGAAQAPSKGSWLVVGEDSAVRRGLVMRLGETARAASVDPTNPADLERAITEVGSAALAGVICLVRHRASPTASPVEAAVRVSAEALELVQTLLRQAGGRTLRVLFVTRGARAVFGDRVAMAVDPGRLATSPLLGIVRVLRREHPELETTLVDLDATADPAEDVAILLAEIAAREEPEVVYRASERFLPRLVRAANAARTMDERTALSAGGAGGSAPAAISKDATYLITGGLGALGLRVARSLVAKGARHLVLVGRSPANEEAKAALSVMESKGASITVAAADVGDRSQLEAVLLAIPAARPLRGVVHAAGALQDGVLITETAERFRRVMGPKAAGAFHLHELTKGAPLDFFVLFSSASALIGSAGQSAYAAANAFLDALSAERKAQGLAALSIAWGPWSGGGMFSKLPEPIRRRIEGDGLGPLTPQEGIGLFDRALAQDRAYVAAFVLDVHRLRNSPGTSPLLREVVGASQLQADGEADLLGHLRKLKREAREGHLRVVLQTEVSQILGMASASAVPLERPFRELGLDSLMAVELRNRLAKRIGRALPATLAFEYPTIARQASFILDHVGLGDDAQVPIKPTITTVPERLLIGMNLSSMSDEDLIARMRATLE